MMSDNDEIAMPGEGSRSNLDVAKPTQPQPMAVPLERIHPYERNPRQGTNPECERIKASILATGLDQPVRPEILALGTLIETTIERASVKPSKRPGDSMLFHGNRLRTFPVQVVKDPVLEPVDKLVWMIILLQARANSAHAVFPSYDYIQRTANIASKSTVAGSIAVLRATRWLTLCARIRERSGRYGGNVYALRDEPLSLVDVLHLDSGYMAFL